VCACVCVCTGTTREVTQLLDNQGRWRTSNGYFAQRQWRTVQYIYSGGQVGNMSPATSHRLGYSRAPWSLFRDESWFSILLRTNSRPRPASLSLCWFSRTKAQNWLQYTHTAGAVNWLLSFVYFVWTRALTWLKEFRSLCTHKLPSCSWYVEGDCLSLEWQIRFLAFYWLYFVDIVTDPTISGPVMWWGELSVFVCLSVACGHTAGIMGWVGLYDFGQQGQRPCLILN